MSDDFITPSRCTHSTTDGPYRESRVPRLPQPTARRVPVGRGGPDAVLALVLLPTGSVVSGDAAGEAEPHAPSEPAEPAAAH